jgi:hypothetical protein
MKYHDIIKLDGNGVDISVCTGKGKIVRAAFVTHRKALLNRRILIKMYKNFTGFS